MNHRSALLQQTVLDMHRPGADEVRVGEDSLFLSDVRPSGLPGVSGYAREIS